MTKWAMLSQADLIPQFERAVEEADKLFSILLDIKDGDTLKPKGEVPIQSLWERSMDIKHAYEDMGMDIDAWKEAAEKGDLEYKRMHKQNCTECGKPHSSEITCNQYAMEEAEWRKDTCQ